MQALNFNGKGRSRLAIWAVLVLAAVGVLALGAIHVIGPRPCTSCHDGAFRTATNGSPHSGVDCRTCHLAPGVAGRVVFAVQQPLHTYFPLAREANRDAATVPNSRCKSCHQESLVGVVVRNGVKVNHSSCAAQSSCTDCHSAVAHGDATGWVRSFDMDSCLGCHVALGRVECDLCHEGRPATARASFASWAVTHGPNWKTTHGMGDAITCAVCHKAGDCADCHGLGVPHESSFISVHASYASGSNARCSTCHTDDFCMDCHRTEMPHAPGFTSAHPDSAKASPDDCKRCHDESDCRNCHVKHVHPGGAIGTAATQGGGKK